MFPPHKASLTLQHNDYRDYYDTITEGVAVQDEEQTWVSPEEREKALATESIWTLQWYPETPIGFHKLAASTLEALLEAARSVK